MITIEINKYPRGVCFAADTEIFIQHDAPHCHCFSVEHGRCVLGTAVIEVELLLMAIKDPGVFLALGDHFK